MSFNIKNFKDFLLNSIPLIIFYYITLSEFSFGFEYKIFFHINLQYIIIYYWVLKNPKTLGYGFIFLAGIINDVILGLPIGVSATTYLIMAGVAAYFRHVTVRITMLSDWSTFLLSLLITNFVYVIIFLIFFELSLNYLNLFYNCILTFIFYPLAWFLFEILRKLIKV